MEYTISKVFNSLLKKLRLLTKISFVAEIAERFLLLIFQYKLTKKQTNKKTSDQVKILSAVN